MATFNPLEHPIIFTEPARLDVPPFLPSTWIGHLPFGMALIDLLRPRLVVELGAYTGVSYCAFCQAVAELGVAAQCFAVDHWEGDPHTGAYGPEILADLRAYHDPRYGLFSSLVQSNFDAARDHFADGSIDLLHIDGYHTYEAVRHDWLAWLPKLSARGVVLLHDIEARHLDFGVYRLWEEIEREYPHFALRHSFGLGVAAVGPDVPAALRPILDADEGEAQRLRALFFQLGQRLVGRLDAEWRDRERTREHQRRVQQFADQIADMEHAVQFLNARLVEQREVAQRYEQLAAEHNRLHGELTVAWQELHRAATRLQLIDGRLSWQVLERFWRWQLRLLPLDSRRGRLWLGGARAARRLVGAGPAPLALSAPEGTVPALPPPAPPVALDPDARYERWIRQSESLLYNRARAERAMAGFTRRPLISVIVPVYNTPADCLSAAIESVLAQYYPHWELCLCDDASTVPEIRHILTAYAARDPRIKVAFSPRSAGIGLTSQRALELATGDYVALLDHDDTLAPDALFTLAAALQEGDADLLYSDMDLLDPEGRRCSPCYKPGWSFDLFLSCMYTCHLNAFRKDLVDAVGGFRAGFDGAQDYDLILRFLDRVRTVVQIPRTLYHWRQVPGSLVMGLEAKPYAPSAGRRALDGYLQRNGIPGQASEVPGLLGFWTIRREITRPGKVTIVIPVPADPDELRRCLASLAARTAYEPYEILLVAPEQPAPAMRDELAHTPHRVIYVDGPPTLPHLLNRAAREAGGEYLLLLDSACEALAPTWLSALVEHGQRPEVGAVGAKLLDPAGRVQHAGFVLGLDGLASPSHRGHDGYADPGYLGFLRFTRNYSVVSDACLLIRRDLFLALGGLNERELALAGSGLDLCLRLWQRGYAIVFTPHALLRRHRPDDPAPGAIDPGAEAYLRRTWAGVLEDDPFYSPNQTREGPGFAVDFDKLEGTRYLYTAPPGAATVAPLGPGRVVSQDFVAAADGLCGISLRFGTDGRRCAGTVRFRLTREGQPDLVVDADAADIEDGRFHIFAFAPLDDSGGRQYRFTVEYVNPAPASALTIWRTATTDPVAGPWRDNGAPQVGTLAFKAFAPGPPFRRFAHRAPDDPLLLLARLAGGTREEPSVGAFPVLLAGDGAGGSGAGSARRDSDGERGPGDDPERAVPGTPRRERDDRLAGAHAEGDGDE